jgi:hypothetical protein
MPIASPQILIAVDVAFLERLRHADISRLKNIAQHFKG